MYIKSAFNKMKKIIVLRHAKSSWKDLSLGDFHRPLNGRGKTDGPIMSRYLSKKIDCIDYLHSSSSVRTFETSKFFISKIEFKNIKYDDNLYHGSGQSIISFIKNYPDQYNSVMIIAHNPGLTNLINMITHINLDNFPTTGIANIDFDCDSWNNISIENSNLVDLKFPKQLK
jgi:phosphohistidine phosphatase